MFYPIQKEVFVIQVRERVGGGSTDLVGKSDKHERMSRPDVEVIVIE
jgi:hypothetical protein